MSGGGVEIVDTLVCVLAISVTDAIRCGEASSVG